jgi:hypothetical protein
MMVEFVEDILVILKEIDHKEIKHELVIEELMLIVLVDGELMKNI